ncbi:hypothetical protein O181_112014 [Austropuccinia psidii MF-1]|uniref:Uncharacterized protein n=1 Tax=Austropuccinia psidii MF-1 TaxID=1389203 RepID=A0A9Q3PSC2_9BASI|nr:hypothetical protein [Austropuccinia psidii MF-1]
MPLTLPSHWPNPQHNQPSLQSCRTLKLTLQFLPPSPPSPLLTLLHPATYSPYIPMAPSRYTSNTAFNPPYASSLSACDSKQSTSMTSNIP